MIVRIRKVRSIREWALLIVFYLLVFQNPLAQVFSIFAYVDEACALLGVMVVFLQGLRTKKLRISTSYSRLVLVIILFFVIGFAGNLIYRIQPWKAVLIDVFTNAKYFLAIITGYVLFSMCEVERKNNVVVGHARVISLVLFALVCADSVLHIFPADPDGKVSEGIRLFYTHETFLAGAMVFLLTVLTAFYEKKNRPYIVMALIVLLSTMKSKAFGGAVIYIACVYFLLVRRKKINIMHMVLMAATALAVGWDKIVFYFVELEGEGARSAMLTTSFQVMQDYFPIGAGFGTYGSAVAMEYYSPLYYEYGLNNIWGLSETFSNFGSDAFWPIILGQTGLLGTICFIAILVLLFKQLKMISKISTRAYTAGVFALAYTLVSSFAESGFHNPLCVPLAVMIGYALTLDQKGKEQNQVI